MKGRHYNIKRRTSRNFLRAQDVLFINTRIGWHKLFLGNVQQVPKNSKNQIKTCDVIRMLQVCDKDNMYNPFIITATITFLYSKSVTGLKQSPSGYFDSSLKSQRLVNLVIFHWMIFIQFLILLVIKNDRTSLFTGSMSDHETLHFTKNSPDILD